MVRIFFSKVNSGLGRKYTGHDWDSADPNAKLGTEVKEVQILSCLFNVLCKYRVISLEHFLAS